MITITISSTVGTSLIEPEESLIRGPLIFGKSADELGQPKMKAGQRHDGQSLTTNHRLQTCEGIRHPDEREPQDPADSAMAGYMMALSSRRSITLKVSDALRATASLR